MSHLALGGTGVDSREFVALQCERVEEERAQCPDASGSTIPSLGEAEDHHEQDQLDGHQPGGTDRATGGVRDPRSGEELWRRCMEGRRRIDLLVEDYQRSLATRRVAFYEMIEALHRDREGHVMPRNMQSYSSYWQDEMGQCPPRIITSPGYSERLRRLNAALEDGGWTPQEEKIFKALVLKEKAAIQARLGLEGKDIPLLGRMTETARREDDKVERMLDWRKS
ncbi:hypothetical protein Naga_100134g15 [Nannochloropsis gaditana]|uniref:Uncharacterized protein n=1 Tax=Nannochloropsis gaditana TaxID=72520 RepID=W7TZ79_9STRA|nr:hypothetical protein Naga_100134g15 [Nannochloropsis gaditana]